ncbi:TonB-dependent siderophore receptor [Verticiella sediminum]|nr:TonB-dependent receptor [Verticiella sediminum]
MSRHRFHARARLGGMRSTPGSVAAVSLATVLCAVLAGAGVLPAPAFAASNNPVRHAVDIPAGPLAEAINRFSVASGASIAFDAGPLAQVRTDGLRGSYTVEEGLARLLAGSGYEAVPRGAAGYALRPVAQAEVGPAPVTLGTVTVTGEVPTYMADRPSSTATKTDLLPRETPFSVDQVTSDMIQERGDADIFATLEGFAGLTTNSSNSDAGGGHSRAIQIRGFASGQTLINGIPSYSDTAGTLRGTDSLEMVELLRGPAGLYYGSAEPGGVISYQYKRPQPRAAYVLRMETDDKGSYGGMVDMTGPLEAEGRLMYRLVGSYKHRKDDQDHIWSEPKSAMAAFTLRPNADFDTTLTYERMAVRSVPEQENNFMISRGALAGQYYPVPRDFFWGSLNDRVVRNTDTLIWDATWSRSEALKIRGGATYQRYDQWWQNTRADAAAGGPDADGNVKRYVSGRQSEGESYSGSLDFTGVARHGDWRHDWLLGAGYGRSEGSSSGRAVASQSRSGPYAVDPINIHDPVYTDYPYQFLIWEDPLVPAATRTDTSFYLQDMLHLPDGRTRFMLGAGWSRYRSAPSTGEANTVQRWSPRLAAMYDITPAVTVYASYGESFLPQPSLTYLDLQGNYITRPVEGVQYEAGLKADLFEGSAMFTGALFRVEKKNVATEQEGLICEPGQPARPWPDLPDPEDRCYGLTGLTRAQGVELRLTGQIMDGWVAQLGYSYTQAKYLRTDSVAALGNSVEYTPRHNLSIWNKFRLYRAPGVGEVSLGLGLRAWSRVHSPWSGGTDSPPTANWNPGYGLVDLGLYWDKPIGHDKQLKLALNVSNLFDKAYYERRRFPPGTVLYGDERRISLSAQLSF